MNEVIAIPAFQDNYLWLIVSRDESTACIVDPGDAGPVLDVLRERSLQLSSILVTHHHFDHVNGINELCQVFPDCIVYGPALENIPQRSVALHDKDQVEFDHLTFEVMDVPGHTEGHIAYYCEEEKRLFSGDTLFGMGCGRLLGGTAEQLYQSLNYIKQLPKDTQVYCTHEYTMANLAFAKAVEPENQLIVGHEQFVMALRSKDKPSVPLLLENEMQCNPFLRCDDPAIKDAVGKHSQKSLPTAQDVFTQLRIWKDNF